MKLSRESVGLAVRAARDAAKLTAGDLCKAAQVDRSSLSRVENGLRALDFAEAVSICRVLKIEVEVLRTLAETFEKEGVTENRKAQRGLAEELNRIQRLAIEAAVELSNH